MLPLVSNVVALMPPARLAISEGADLPGVRRSWRSVGVSLKISVSSGAQVGPFTKRKPVATFSTKTAPGCWAKSAAASANKGSRVRIIFDERAFEVLGLFAPLYVAADAGDLVGAGRLS